MFFSNHISQEKVQEKYLNMFEALPESYQNDSVLDFYFEDSYLKCCPKKDQVWALGQWTCFFDDDPELQCWCNDKTGEPINI